MPHNFHFLKSERDRLRRVHACGMHCIYSGPCVIHVSPCVRVDSTGLKSSVQPVNLVISLILLRSDPRRAEFHTQTIRNMIHGLVSVLIVLSVILIYGEVQKWRIQRKMKAFTMPKTWPVIGVAGRFLNKKNEEIIDIVMDIFDEAKTTPAQTWLGPVLGVLLDAPRDVQLVLTNEHCLDKPFLYDMLHCRNSLISASKEMWRGDRRALNTSFSPRILQGYIPLINEKVRMLVERFGTHVDRPDGDLYKTIFIGMIDTVIRTIMGADVHAQSTELGVDLYNTVKKIMSCIQYRVSRFWLKWDFTYSLSHVYRDELPTLNFGNEFLLNMYLEKLAEFEQNKGQRFDGNNNNSNDDGGVDDNGDGDLAKPGQPNNFVEKLIMMENDGVLCRERVLDQARLILMAGVDTSSINVFGTLLMLAIHPQHQELCVAELKTVFDSSDSDVLEEDTKKLSYLERCIRESLRLFPPGPFIARRTSAEIQLDSGLIPPNTGILINILRMHRSPAIWGPNAHEFDPDRFLPECVASRPPFSYIPFSAGARNCIGMRYAMLSAKITLAHLLRHYRFSSDLKIADVRMKIHLVLEIINENAIVVEKRQFI